MPVKSPGFDRLSIAVSLLWAGFLVLSAIYVVKLPVFTLMPTIMTAFLAPGLVFMAMIATLALRREGLARDLDRQVTQDTMLFLVMALAIWPAAAVLLAGQGPGMILVLGLGFVPARILAWIGIHRSRTLSLLGAWSTFMPTFLVVLWIPLRFLL